MRGSFSNLTSPCGLGFDFGTSGVRINVLESGRRGMVFEAAQPWPYPGAVEVRRHRQAFVSATREIPSAFASSGLIDKVLIAFFPPQSINVHVGCQRLA